MAYMANIVFEDLAWRGLRSEKHEHYVQHLIQTMANAYKRKE